MKPSAKVLVAALAVVGLLKSTAAQADVGCTLTVNSTAIDTSGNLNVSLINANAEWLWWYICNTSGSVSVNNGYGTYTIASDACKSMHTQFLTARASNRPITLWFHGLANCAAAALPATASQRSPFPTNFSF